MISKRPNFAAITDNTIISIVPEQYHTQPFSHNRYRQVQTQSKFALQLLEFCSQPPGLRMPQYHELSISVFAAYVGKTKKLKCFGFTLALALAVLGGKTPLLAVKD